MAHSIQKQLDDLNSQIEELKLNQARNMAQNSLCSGTSVLTAIIFVIVLVLFRNRLFA